MKSLTKQYTSFAVFAFAAALAVFSACEKDSIKNFRKGDPSSFGIKLLTTTTRDVATGAIGTKAIAISEPTNVYCSKDGGMLISEYVTDIDDIVPATKGYEITTGNIGEKYGTFAVDAWAMLPTSDNTKANEEILTPTQYFNQNSSYSSGSWNWVGTAPTWMISTPLTMWSYAPVGVFSPTIDKTEGHEFEKLDFSYSAPSNFDDHKDLLVAYNVETRDFQKNADGTYKKDGEGNLIFETGQNENVPIHFYHALAAIRLELANKGIADDVYIKQVSISGVYGDGDCTVSGNAGSPVTFDWDCNDYTKKTFTETYNNDKINPAASLAESSKSFRARYSSAGGAGEMFMIPQTLSGAKMIIKFSKKGIVVTKEIALNNVTWEAGKYYTYKVQATIHVPGEYLLEDIGFNIGDFKSPRTSYMFQESAGYGSPIEAVGIKKIGVVFTSHSFNDPSRKTTSANFYVSNGKDSTPQKNSKGSTVEYDFAPVPDSEVCPYASVDPTHVSETYSGNLDVFKTSPVPMYYVFDIEGYDKFDFTLDVASTSNSAKWSGTISRVIVLEVEGIEKNPDGTYVYEYDYEEPVK